MSKNSHLCLVAYSHGGADCSRQDDSQGLWTLERSAMDVTIVSAATAQSLEEAPSIMTVITRRDIERWGYDTLSDA